MSAGLARLRRRRVRCKFCGERGVHMCPGGVHSPSWSIGWFYEYERISPGLVDAHAFPATMERLRFLDAARFFDDGPKAQRDAERHRATWAPVLDRVPFVRRPHAHLLEGKR